MPSPKLYFVASAREGLLHRPVISVMYLLVSYKKVGMFAVMIEPSAVGNRIPLG
jgi:hypothetical protein